MSCRSEAPPPPQQFQGRAAHSPCESPPHAALPSCHPAAPPSITAQAAGASTSAQAARLHSHSAHTTPAPVTSGDQRSCSGQSGGAYLFKKFGGV